MGIISYFKGQNSSESEEWELGRLLMGPQADRHWNRIEIQTLRFIHNNIKISQYC